MMERLNQVQYLREISSTSWKPLVLNWTIFYQLFLHKYLSAFNTDVQHDLLKLERPSSKYNKLEEYTN